jgi:hypothetical protein
MKSRKQDPLSSRALLERIGLGDPQAAGLLLDDDPLDLVLGLFLDEGEHRGDFLSGHFDGRRFQPWLEGEPA